MKKTLGVTLILVVLGLLGLFWRHTRGPAPAPGTAPAQTGSVPLPAGAEIGGCDGQPRPPKLPDGLTPASDDITGIVRALDTALGAEHKTWLRCFTLDDELLARTQSGMGRWLRGTLNLTRRAPLLTSLGATTPDEASSLIILVYTAHLRGQNLTLAEARTRRAEALALAGVKP